MNYKAMTSNRKFIFFNKKNFKKFNTVQNIKNRNSLCTLSLFELIYQLELFAVISAHCAEKNRRRQTLHNHHAQLEQQPHVEVFLLLN